MAQRYKLDAETLALPPYELLQAIGRKRGMLVRGGEVDTERCAVMLVGVPRQQVGTLSLERPPQRDDMDDYAEEDDKMKTPDDEESSPTPRSMRTMPTKRAAHGCSAAWTRRAAALCAARSACAAASLTPRTPLRASTTPKS